MSNDAQTPQTQPDKDDETHLGKQRWDEPQAPPKWAAGEPLAVRSDKPPIIPFSPIDVGQLVDGTVKAVLTNAKVMFTISLVTMAVLGLIAAAFSLATGGSVETSLDGTGATFKVEDASGWAAALEFLVDLIPPLASVLVAGALVLTVTNAVIGRKLTLSETLNLLKSRAWKLLGTAVLTGIVVFGAAAILLLGYSVVERVLPDNFLLTILMLLYILAVPAVILWLSVRLYFPTMVAVVEETSPVLALKRSWQLTSGSFWRIFGRLLLLFAAMGTATGILSGVVGLIGGSIPGAFGASLTVFLVSLISELMMPFSASYDSLMYVDARMRAEDLGPVLESDWKANR